MRCLQKLCKCGNATHFTIPRAALFYLGWLPGESMVLELLEDKSIRIRRLTADDVTIKGAASIKLADNLPMPT